MIGSIIIDTVLKEVSIKGISTTAAGHVKCDRCCDNICPVVRIESDYDPHDYHGSEDDSCKIILDRLQKGHSPGAGIRKYKSDPLQWKLVYAAYYSNMLEVVLRYFTVTQKTMENAVIIPEIFTALCKLQPETIKPNRQLLSKLIKGKWSGSPCEMMLSALNSYVIPSNFSVLHGDDRITYIYKKDIVWHVLTCVTGIDKEITHWTCVTPEALGNYIAELPPVHRTSKASGSIDHFKITPEGDDNFLLTPVYKD